MFRQHPRWWPLVAGALACVLALAGCTGDVAERDDPEPSSSTAAPAVERRAATSSVELASGAGKLPKQRRSKTRKQVAAVVDDYLRRAYLGDYPRTTYRGVFRSFTGAARQRARRDSGLLTHADRGARYVAVTPRRAQVRVHAFTPGQRVLGATARVRLVLLVERDDDTVQRVRVSGRLLLTRARDNSFQIFGYDLRRTSGRPRAGGGE